MSLDVSTTSLDCEEKAPNCDKVWTTLVLPFTKWQICTAPSPLFTLQRSGYRDKYQEWISPVN